MTTKNEVVLVTGGAGAIGSRLVRQLVKEHQVIVLDDLSSGYIENLRDLPVTFLRGSIIDEEVLTEVFAQPLTVVFHLAANFANQNSVDYPQKDLLVNGMGTLKLLQYARRANIRRFIYSSSSCVYGNGHTSLSETVREYSLDTPYAVTKLLGEQYVNFFHRHHSMQTVILRFFNSYGPGEYPGKYRNVIPNFIFRALRGEPLVITGTGDETRDFTYVDDIVRALLLAMRRPEAVGKTFNIGSGAETSIRKLAEFVRNVCEVNVPIEYREKREWDTVMRRCANISSAREVIGYEPAVDLKAGLTLTHRWFVEDNILEFTPL